MANASARVWFDLAVSSGDGQAEQDRLLAQQAGGVVAQNLHLLVLKGARSRLIVGQIGVVGRFGAMRAVKVCCWLECL